MTKMRSKYRPFLRQITIAALTTVLLYYAVLFIHQGTIWVFNLGILIELTFVFFFLLAIFWSHSLISKTFTSAATHKLPYFWKPVLEGLTVVVSSIIICYLLYFLPYTIFFSLAGVKLVLLPERVRLAYVISSIASLFFYYFVERQRNIKQLQAEHLRAEQLQKENFRAQLESLKNQVNPHFLFNSLNVLNSLIYVDPDKAAAFLSQLSDVYRALLDNSNKQLVPLQKELNLANSYSYLMKTRFGDSVQINTDVPSDKLSLELPPSSLQMLIENAIKHNGSTKQKPLRICIYTEGDALIVKNNRQPRLEEVKSTKVGLKNIRNRYSYITDRQVTVEQTADAFLVKLPLLKVEA
ncbi:histidine kinase [Pontibacter ummariensis]|uniref:Histidine kinase n=1 Tax=Pontibacter ummariensis TaxID=1610492 RepID=A0A239L4K9_9BACT|nr:histidine kinase [Pontibacter ummariensis]PRY04271.1 histidine kinase [Pontibacter ummariensis]SNT25526.1 Histidine kinase [Pontibacter ummariensis]